jgi:hypothetical protein
LFAEHALESFFDEGLALLVQLEAVLERRDQGRANGRMHLHRHGQSEAINRNQGQSSAIKRNQAQSSAIKRNQAHAPWP